MLTSDHGMTDDGNHGGSSPDELSTPLVFVGSAFKRSTSSARKEGDDFEMIYYFLCHSNLYGFIFER